MVKSKMTKDNLTLDSIGRIHLTLLKISGTLAFDHKNLNYLPTILLSFYVHCSHGMITTMYMWSVMANLLDRRYDVEIVAECVGLCGVHSRFLVMYARRARVAELLKQSRSLWNELFENEKLMIKSFVGRSTRIVSFYITASVAMCIFYLVVSQVPTTPLAETNETSTRLLPYVFYTDVQKTPWYELVVVIQTMTMMSISLSCSGIDTAGPFFIMIASGLFKTLCTRIHRLIQLDANGRLNDRNAKIIECIVFHQKIIRYCKEVEKLTTLLFMIQLISTTYNMSLFCLKLVGDDPDKFKYSTVLTILLLQLFVCQWAPDILVSESELLTRSAYHVPLSGKDNKNIAKIIYIMVMRSQRSIQLTAGGYINLSMESFGSMITSALSFFTVLRSVH